MVEFSTRRLRLTATVLGYWTQTATSLAPPDETETVRVSTSQSMIRSMIGLAEDRFPLPPNLTDLRHLNS
jgi:hypothetical protein